MGVDVKFRVEASPRLTDTEFNELCDAFREKFPGESAVGEGRRLPNSWLRRSRDVDNVVVLKSMHRAYYPADNPVVEAGHWPSIRAMGDWLTTTMENRGEVRYGNDLADDGDDGDPLWADIRDEYDHAWETRTEREVMCLLGDLSQAVWAASWTSRIERDVLELIVSGGHRMSDGDFADGTFAEVAGLVERLAELTLREGWWPVFPADVSLPGADDMRRVPVYDLQEELGDGAPNATTIRGAVNADHPWWTSK